VNVSGQAAVGLFLVGGNVCWADQVGKGAR